MQKSLESNNLSYQGAESPLGGFYTEKKLHKIGLPELSGKKFLDLGCNSGFFCNYAKRQGAVRAVGVDIDKEVIALARHAYPEVEFFDEGWDTFPSGMFDVVILLSAIHYARDPVAVIENVYEHLTPGGLLILEGGLLDSEGRWKTDSLVPGWRKVGDRCRHLSLAYARDHLLRSFDFVLWGASEPRGGDDVPRHVIHAHKSERRSRCHQHTVDAVEYSNGLAMSAKTIVKEQPSFEYVSQLGSCDSLTAAIVEELIIDRGALELFADDLAYVLEPSQPIPVVLLPVLSPFAMAALAAGLKVRGIHVARAQ